MSTLALNIRMHGKTAVVIGGGTVALRKIRTLLAAGASVRVAGTTVCPEIAALNDSGALAVRVGSYAASDLDGAFLVIAATDDALAVSTGGRCPTFAVDVRDRIAEHIGAEYGTILQLLTAEREKLLTNGSSSTYNAQVLRSLAGRLLAEFTERKESLP